MKCPQVGGSLRPLVSFCLLDPTSSMGYFSSSLNYLSGGLDSEGNELPCLVYVSREKHPGFQHHKKAGAMNALVRVSAVLTNGPFLLNLDCNHYINNCKAIREANDSQNVY